MTRARDGGARGRPTFGKGDPGVPAGGHRHGVGSPNPAFSVGLLATCRRGGSRGRGRLQYGHFTLSGGAPGGWSSYTRGAR